jgi:hypothetical protein
VSGRLEYASSIFGKGVFQGLMPDIDFMVQVKLVWRTLSGRSSGMLFLSPKLTDKPGATEDPPYSMSTWETRRCHAISGLLLPATAMSAWCFGETGESRGGRDSLMLGTIIGMEEVENGGAKL